MPVYGNGNNIRDWLFVEDHVDAIDLIFHNSKIGNTYNIGGNNELRNIDLVHKLIQITDEALGRLPGSSLSLISFVDDRKGHDYRYAIDSSKIKFDLDWKPKYDFETAIKKTVLWYINRHNLSNE